MQKNIQTDKEIVEVFQMFDTSILLQGACILSIILVYRWLMCINLQTYIQYTLNKRKYKKKIQTNKEIEEIIA